MGRLAVLLAALAALPAAADTVRLGGTGSALATMSRLAQAYRQQDPTFTLEIVPNLGSGGGLKALQSGTVQLAAVSRPLKADEQAAGLRAAEYGRTAFVLATHKDSVRNLSLTQAVDLVAGRQSRWPDGQPVRLVLRPRNDADTDLLAAFSPDMKAAVATAQAREGMVVGLTDQEAVDAIERLPGGLGTASMALLLAEQRRARGLAIDGVEPTVANVVSGRYPHVKPMALVTGHATPASALRFVAFVQSEAGRKLLAELGHAPPQAAAAVASAGPEPAARPQR